MTRAERVAEVFAGISAEVAGLPWDWRERTSVERMRDERRPLFVRERIERQAIRDALWPAGSPLSALSALAEPRVEYVGVVDGAFEFVVSEGRAA